MSATLQLGPLALPLSLLLVLAAAATAFAVGRHAARGSGRGELVETVLWQALLVAVLVARLAFVWEYRVTYFAVPLDMLDIRDGGWTPWVGAVGAWLFALRRQASQPALVKPLRRALAAGSALWLAGTVALALLPQTGRPLPPLAFVSLDGRAMSLDAFRGRPTVINLWATWCPPCRREMPVLQQAQAAQPGVHFVFVNQGEPAPQVARWLAAQQLPLRNVLMDPRGQLAAAFDQNALPTTLFFDAQGRLAGSRIGELSRATLAQRLQDLQR